MLKRSSILLTQLFEPIFEIDRPAVACESSLFEISRKKKIYIVREDNKIGDAKDNYYIMQSLRKY